jgi:hypothetical protein
MGGGRLKISLAQHHEYTKLELRGAWPPAVPDLCQLVKEKFPKMVFLMETKLRAVRIETLKSRLGFDNVFVVDSKGRSGV